MIEYRFIQYHKTLNSLIVIVRRTTNLHLQKHHVQPILCECVCVCVVVDFNIPTAFRPGRELRVWRNQKKTIASRAPRVRLFARVHTQSHTCQAHSEYFARIYIIVSSSSVIIQQLQTRAFVAKPFGTTSAHHVGVRGPGRRAPSVSCEFQPTRMKSPQHTYRTL